MDQPTNCDSAYNSYSHIIKFDLILWVNNGIIVLFLKYLLTSFSDKQSAENVLSYMKTKFVRFLMLLSMSGFGLSKQVINFIPMQDFNQTWSDQQLNTKYGLTKEEIEFIDSMIRPYDDGGDV